MDDYIPDAELYSYSNQLAMSDPSLLAANYRERLSIMHEVQNQLNTVLEDRTGDCL